MINTLTISVRFEVKFDLIMQHILHLQYFDTYLCSQSLKAVFRRLYYNKYYVLTNLTLIFEMLCKVIEE